MNPSWCPLQADDSGAILLDFAAGRLQGAAAALIEQHLAVCDSCREFVQAQKTIWAALDAWDAVEASPGFDARLLARLQDERRPWWRCLTPASTSGWRTAASVALAGVLIVAALFIRKPEPAVLLHDQAALEAEVEQIDQALSDLDMLKQLGIAGTKFGSLRHAL
jgi:anti-sigma factor RsiW